MRRPGWRDHLVGALLATTYVALLMATSVDLAMSRDESFYVVAAERYAGWIEQAWDDFETASQKDAVDRAWSYNHEHPALAKAAFALSYLAHDAWDVFPTPGMSYRFPGMLAAGLLLWLVYIFGARVYGRQAGAFAAVSLALLPRPFYHAHLDAFDVPITLMLTLVTYCYWRSLDDRRWALWTGVAFGLALGTKHNAWILPGVFLIHWAWAIWGELRARRKGEPKRLLLVPWWLAAMAVLGPLMFVGSWPWLWNDTGARIDEYVAFHVHHEYYNMAYFGRNYFYPPFPVSFPWVMTLYTVPLTVIALCLAGIGLRARALLPPGLEGRVWPGGGANADRRHTDVLLIGCMLAPLVVISLPSTPIFGGTKHWFPSYPFMCMFAGLAFWRVARALRAIVGNRVPAARWVVRGLTAVVLLVPGAVETVHSHPFGLSHYGYAAGGVPGAADDGMNRQFWGFTHGVLGDFFREQLPDGGTVYICDATHQSWVVSQRDGLIPENVRPTGNLANADLILVHHEHHFAEVDYQAWVATGSVQPLEVLTYDGVPIVTIYDNRRR